MNLSAVVTNVSMNLVAGACGSIQGADAMMIRNLFFPGVGPIPEMAAFDITVVDFTAPPADLIFDAVAFYGARFLSIQLPPVVLNLCMGLCCKHGVWLHSFLCFRPQRTLSLAALFGCLDHMFEMPVPAGVSSDIAHLAANWTASNVNECFRLAIGAMMGPAAFPS